MKRDAVVTICLLVTEETALPKEGAVDIVITTKMAIVPFGTAGTKGPALLCDKDTPWYHREKTTGLNFDFWFEKKNIALAGN